MKANDASELWTVKDVMARLCIQRTCAAGIIRSLPHIKLGRSLRVEKVLVEDYIRNHYVTPEGSKTVSGPVKQKKKQLPMPGFDENGRLLRKKRMA